MRLSLALLPAVVLCEQKSLAQKGNIYFRDVLRVDPVHYAKDFENERTRVLPRDVHLERGQTRWIGGGARTEKNLGTQSLEMSFIEQKLNRPA